MTVKQFADELDLWQIIELGAEKILPQEIATALLEVIAEIPIHKSSATRRLGAYVSMAQKPVYIRLQFAQEPENLRQTFLHEVAHACDHLSCVGGRRFSRRAHGSSWKAWANALGISPRSYGESGAVRELHRQRLKLVAVCLKCGAEFHRVRRLDKRKKYTHSQCGGEIQKV